ncbi:huntingtin-interacting protein 1 isoform X2 [Procambarus clarkii]|uniref:huntingtin-interacting protein 1 isoform X2 n=1 Tax=Procambarus clarkii TaxID=6728 RepID=UPI001E671A27|nr:huntingtin-interacting protein 1-like [Procambarus clarkii]
MTSTRRIPPGLGSRRNSALHDRKIFERSQEASFRKVLNKEDVAIKTKHIRTLVLGTHSDGSAALFWRSAAVCPPISTDVTAWKFCYCLHRLCRDGHPRVLHDSFPHLNMVTNIGQHFKHLTNGYGPVITPYCQLLVAKLKFHHHNPGCPGSLSLSQHQLQALTGDDVNSCFELAVDMLEYMEDLLTLTDAVILSVKGAAPGSTSKPGHRECLLAPLVPCIQESSCLYDMTLALLNKLHQGLPWEMLEGHRSRFSKQFTQLRHLYTHAEGTSYLTCLTVVPHLPQEVPDFLSETGLQNHETFLPEEQPAAANTSCSLSEYETLVVEQQPAAADTLCSPPEHEALEVEQQPTASDASCSPPEYEALEVEQQPTASDASCSPPEYEALVVGQQPTAADTSCSPPEYEALETGVNELHEVVDTSCTIIPSPYRIPPESYNPNCSSLPSPLQLAFISPPHLLPSPVLRFPPPVPERLPPRPLPQPRVYHPPQQFSLPSPLLRTLSRPHLPPPPIPSLLPTHPPIYQEVHKGAQRHNQEKLHDQLH